MDRGAKYRHGLAKEKRLVQLTRELGWTAEDVRTAEELLGALPHARARFSLSSAY
jgi:acyl-CoA oxidase